MNAVLVVLENLDDVSGSHEGLISSVSCISCMYACTARATGGVVVVGAGTQSSVVRLLVTGCCVVSWFAAIKAGVVFQMFSLLLRGERIEVDVHVISSLGGGAASIVLQPAAMLVIVVCFASYLEVLFEGFSLGIISCLWGAV